MRQLFLSEADIARVRGGDTASVRFSHPKVHPGDQLLFYSGTDAETVVVEDVLPGNVAGLEAAGGLLKKAGYATFADWLASWPPDIRETIKPRRRVWVILFHRPR